MEKSKIFKSLKNKMLIIKYTGRFSFVCSNQRNERKRNEGRKNDWFEIATNRQSNRPTDNRYFFKFYALSIFFPSIRRIDLTSSTLIQILSPQTILLLHFANRSGHRVLADHFWKILSQILTRTLFPLTFNEHLSNKCSTSCNLCCRYSYLYFVEFPFLLFAFNNVPSFFNREISKWKYLLSRLENAENQPPIMQLIDETRLYLAASQFLPFRNWNPPSIYALRSR